jgi:hypothetical protein
MPERPQAGGPETRPPFVERFPDAGTENGEHRGGPRARIPLADEIQLTIEDKVRVQHRTRLASGRNVGHHVPSLGTRPSRRIGDSTYFLENRYLYRYGAHAQYLCWRHGSDTKIPSPPRRCSRTRGEAPSLVTVVHRHRCKLHGHRLGAHLGQRPAWWIGQPPTAENHAVVLRGLRRR